MIWEDSKSRALAFLKNEEFIDLCRYRQSAARRDNGKEIAGMQMALQEYLQQLIKAGEFTKAAGVINGTYYISDFADVLDDGLFKSVRDGLAEKRNHIILVQLIVYQWDNDKFEGLISPQLVENTAEMLSRAETGRAENLGAYARMLRAFDNSGKKDGAEMLALMPDEQRERVALALLDIPEKAPDFVSTLSRLKDESTQRILDRLTPEKIDDLVVKVLANDLSRLCMLWGALGSRPELREAMKKQVYAVMDHFAEHGEFAILSRIGYNSEFVPGMWQKTADILARPQARDAMREENAQIRQHYWLTPPRRFLRGASKFLRGEQLAAA